MSKGESLYRVQFSLLGVTVVEFLVEEETPKTLRLFVKNEDDIEKGSKRSHVLNKEQIDSFSLKKSCQDNRDARFIGFFRCRADGLIKFRDIISGISKAGEENIKATFDAMDTMKFNMKEECYD